MSNELSHCTFILLLSAKRSRPVWEQPRISGISKAANGGGSEEKVCLCDPPGWGVKSMKRSRTCVALRLAWWAQAHHEGAVRIDKNAALVPSVACIPTALAIDSESWGNARDTGMGLRAAHAPQKGLGWLPPRRRIARNKGSRSVKRFVWRRRQAATHRI